eukprot:scaffold124427_cov63-Phaeocystis_antarctica.AAC.2
MGVVSRPACSTSVRRSAENLCSLPGGSGTSRGSAARHRFSTSGSGAQTGSGPKFPDHQPQLGPVPAADIGQHLDRLVVRHVVHRVANDKAHVTDPFPSRARRGPAHEVAVRVRPHPSVHAQPLERPLVRLGLDEQGVHPPELLAREVIPVGALGVIDAVKKHERALVAASADGLQRRPFEDDAHGGGAADCKVLLDYLQALLAAVRLVQQHD